MVLLLPLLLAISCFSTAFALERPSKGNKCIFAKIKTQTKTKKGEAVWITKEDQDTSQRDCNEFCAKVNFNATGKATNNVRSATCFKNDGKTSPYVDDKGKNKSDEMPVGTIVYGAGQCVCDDPMLNDFVMKFVTEALPAVGDLTDGVLKEAGALAAQIGFTVLSILPLGRLPTAAIGLMSQVAETMNWAFEDQYKAAEHFSDWRQNPCGNISKPTTGKRSFLDAETGSDRRKNHMPPEAMRIFTSMNDIFGMGTSFGSAPKLFAGAGKIWPPPFAKGSANLGKTMDFVNSLSNIPTSSDCKKK